MIAFVVLGVVAIAQGVFLVLLIIFVFVRRKTDRSRRNELALAAGELRAPLAEWLAGTGELAPVIGALRAMPADARVGHTSYLARTTLQMEKRNELARGLQAEPWVRGAIAAGALPRWGRRLRAARCLALAGTPADRDMAASLFDDPRPVVALAAVTAFPRVADAELVARVLDRYPSLPAVVERYVNATLREMRGDLEEALAARLVPDAPPASLAAWVGLAGELELARPLRRLDPLVGHVDPMVRRAVARALRRLPSVTTRHRLETLLADPETQVRTEAARSLGEIASPDAIPALLHAVHDRHWEVRYRSALALSQLGNAGRSALWALRDNDDRYVADVATVMSGLSEGALIEMVES